MINVDIEMLQLAVAFLLPLAVGIVTKQVASAKLKAVMLLALTAVTTVTMQAIADNGLITDASVMSAAQNFVISVASYYGVWKPTGVAEKVQDKTKNIGVK